MIVVVLILVILILAFTLAFQFGRKSVPTPTPSPPSPPSKSQEAKEDEDTSSTATAQPIKTAPPEPEDPGTCELTGDWSMTDECNADGTAIFTQAYKESKPGVCPANEKARVKPCCYQKGDWKDISQCQATGKKTQEQTTINCAGNFKTREVDCEYIGPWQKVGGCGADGKQYYSRTTLNSSAETTKSENCCYISPWGGWGAWGGCNGSKRYRNRNRTIVNCPSGTATTDTGSENCNHCQGYWVNSGECNGNCSCNGMCRPTSKKSRSIYHKQKYVISKNASNGGNACPHPAGSTTCSRSYIRTQRC
jgi:Na+-transporting methylmalonyl-CoA/oxaloacetate decarboxylase gamma subunit